MSQLLHTNDALAKAIGIGEAIEQHAMRRAVESAVETRPVEIIGTTNAAPAEPPRFNARSTSRRAFALFAVGALGAAVAGCASAPLAPAPAMPGPVGPPLTGYALVADKVQLIAEAIGDTLPALGLDSRTATRVVEAVSQMAGVAKAILAGGSVSSLALKASELLNGLVGMVGGKAGELMTAALSLMPMILSLAGIRSRARVASQGYMPPDQAEATLRRYARRV